ncbi:MAG: hypothetical protein HYV63_07135 [Candidatus Schekmanbacteria bacterium]|nr:hypothetical protein [Candidatus Schekmanbacteria bacterium]
MAEMLRDIESSEKHLAAARRHGRLVHRIRDGAAYAARLDEPRQRLEARLGARQTAEAALEDARDDLYLADFELDNSVRTVFERASQADRDAMAERLRARLFPHGKFTAITLASAGTAEPDLVEQLAARVESLPEAHPLRPLAADLRAGLAAPFRRAAG